MSNNILPKSSPILAVVGAGSIVWGRSIVIDFFTNPDLADAEIRLIDIDGDRLELVHEWLEFARVRMGGRQRLTAHTDLAEGLRGVTVCLTAIAVGGDRLWRYDVLHPQLDGIFQPVGDTTGPGGAVRALRHAPALRQIAETLSQVGTPDAVLIQLTNPLNALTASLENIPGIRVFGFCHGYIDTEVIFAKALGLVDPHASYDQIYDAPTFPVRVELAGNNHFVFVNRLRIRDRVYEQSDLGELVPGIFDTTFREAVWSRFGVLAGNYARHPIEFLPDFITRRWGFGRAWGVDPIAAEINPLHGERHDVRRAQVVHDLEAARADPTRVDEWRLTHSHEPIAEIVAAFHTGERFDTHLNLPNAGAIAGVSDGHHVELFCRIEGGVVHRPTVAFPDAITREIERVGHSQTLLAQCCRAFDEDTLVEALLLDALVPANPDLIRSLVREMIAFQKELIFPQRF